jgi:hypothetical protein
MKTKQSIWLPILVIAAALTFAGRAEAVLVNPGFEADAVSGADPVPGALGWDTFGNANTASDPTDPVLTGIGSLQLAGSGGFSVPGALQTFTASPGQTWDLQGYGLTPDQLPPNTTFGLLKIVFSDGVNDLEPAAVNIGQAAPAANPGIESLPFIDQSITANTWQFTQAQGVAPEGTVQVSFFAIFVDESEGVVYFDDLQAELIPEPPMQDIYVDIKPTSCPNPLAARSKGVLPVAILGTEDFDVTTIDVATITLAGVSPLRSNLEDVTTPLDKDDECECSSEGPDGFTDLTLKFDRQEIIATLGDLSLLPRRSVIPLTLSCMLMDDDELTLEGTDCIVFLNLRQGK